MEVTATCRERVLELQLKGELDHHGARGLLTKLEREIEATLPAELVLDFSGVTFMDSSGIAVLLRAQRSVQNLGGSVIVCRVPRQAKRVMDAAGIGRLMTIQAGGTDDEK